MGHVLRFGADPSIERRRHGTDRADRMTPIGPAGAVRECTQAITAT